MTDLLTCRVCNFVGEHDLFCVVPPRHPKTLERYEKKYDKATQDAFFNEGLPHVCVDPVKVPEWWHKVYWKEEPDPRYCVRIRVCWRCFKKAKAAEIRRYDDVQRQVEEDRRTKRYVRQRQATPAWVDTKAIDEIYIECQLRSLMTGTMYHVDHIVPIKSAKVCGLHVPWNLRVITAEENMKKGNKFDG